MKKFVLPGLIGALLALVLGVGLYFYPAIHAPDTMTERGVTWESRDGSWVQVREDGGVNGQLTLASGELLEFTLGWREAYGEGFADEDFQELVFTAGLRAWGDRLTFQIEQDRVGLAESRYSFRRAN